MCVHIYTQSSNEPNLSFLRPRRDATSMESNDLETFVSSCTDNSNDDGMKSRVLMIERWRVQFIRYQRYFRYCLFTG